MKEDILKAAIKDLPEAVKKEFLSRYWSCIDALIDEAINYETEENEE